LAAGLIAAQFGLATNCNADEPPAPPAASATSNTAAKSVENEAMIAAVRKLLRQLEAVELQKRDAAEAELLALGPDTLAHLPAETEVANPGVKQALSRVRLKLETVAAQQAAQPSTVTLASESMKLSEVLEAITKQTGNRFQVQRDLETTVKKPLKVKFDKTPFWQALDMVLDQVNGTVYPFEGNEGLVLTVKPNLQLPRTNKGAYAGPLRIDVTQLTLDRDPRSATPPQMRVNLEVAWEPRLQPIVIEHPLAEIKAIDDQNRMWDSQLRQGNSTAMVSPGVNGVELDLLLDSPARTATSLSSLKGKVSLLLPGRVESFEFSQIAKAKNVQKKIAQASVTLEETVKNNELFEIRVKIKYTQAFEAFDSHVAGWILRNQPRLLDPQGKEIPHAGYETTGRSDDEVGLSYYYDVKSLDGCKWIYFCPGAILRIPLEYELKNLSLP